MSFEIKSVKVTSHKNPQLL